MWYSTPVKVKMLHYYSQISGSDMCKNYILIQISRAGTWIPYFWTTL